MGRIARTVELAKSSWQVLMHDKELLALPVISAIASIITAATFLVPLIATLDETEEPGAVFYITAAAVYFLLAIITIYFNAALVHAANDRLNGGDPTIGSALSGAAARFGRIVPWALLSATVSLILRAIEERGGVLGRIVAGLAGMAWSVVTFLVLPVLVIEDIGVGDAFRRSTDMFKRTWGENIAAQIGFGLLGFVAAIPAVLVVILGAAVGGPVLAIGIALAIAWVVLVAVTIQALTGIFQTALYHYAAGGEVPGDYFPPATLNGAFAPR